MVLMQNARIFITNKHDSDAWLAALHQNTGKNQNWHMCVECSDLYHQRTRFRCWICNNSLNITVRNIISTHADNI